MSKTVLISLLKQGQTGNDILQILDALTSEQNVDNQPTIEEVQF